ncbi:MAG TPA: Gfo/Idh/MocA family oxidoreductase [Candidatus Hydrogenedentes bacterium]|nr:Gfo/Idh/MocA family oxidoreductase [Candidatus Hydrogenedentota bacterium]HOK89169.1 Gfo/Idh/MocA family oxidoreductase [Candidatus Hydrogenedentota bacterium]
MNTSTERRDFLRTAASMAVFSVVAPRVAFTYETNGKVSLGLIGCGGRGRWIGRLFQEFAPCKVTALHDPFRFRTYQAGRDLDVPESRRFVGLDGYRELVALEDIDAVAVESPPCFHVDQADAALNAGKHVYMAKPVAVDVAGCLRAVRMADAHPDRCCWVDFQARVDPLYLEALRRVREGHIGFPVFGQTFYHCERLQRQAPPGTPGERLRNWVFDKALSGDIIVEQHIHVIDVTNWVLDAHPLQAIGTGGRKGRVDVGDCWDHFIVAFEYPDGVHVDFSGLQCAVRADADLCARVYGSEGTVDTHYGGPVRLSSTREDWPGGLTSNIYQEGAVTNIRKFCEAVASGSPINNMAVAVDSNLTCILGRMAAYNRASVTWEEMMADTTPMDLHLELEPEAIEIKP